MSVADAVPNTGREALLPEATATLFRRYRRRPDCRTRDALVERFLPWAHRIARRYHAGGESLEDLQQVAALALVKAIDRYDGDRGSAFKAFAAPTIAGELKRHFRDNVWAVHVPRAAKDRALEVHRAARAVGEETGHAPSLAEIGERCGLDEEEVRSAIGAYEALRSASLDAPLRGGEDETFALADTVLGVSDPGYELAIERTTLRPALRRLSMADRRLLYMRFIEQRTQSEIARQIGVSQMQISRRLRRTVEHLRAVTGGGTRAATTGSA